VKNFISVPLTALNRIVICDQLYLLINLVSSMLPPNMHWFWPNFCTLCIIGGKSHNALQQAQCNLSKVLA